MAASARGERRVAREQPVGPASTAGDPGARPMGWSGWGPATAPQDLDERVRELLVAELGPLGPRRPPVVLAQVAVAPSALPPDLGSRLGAIVGTEGIRDDHDIRVHHAGGRSYPDLVRRRAGDAVAAPDAVVLPRTHREVVEVLAVCSEVGVAVVPFGGGTSVVGGVEPVRGRFPAVIALDLRRMARLVDLDPISGIATFEAGLRGPQAEAVLRHHGFTLGHYPQSYAYATLGGMVATRSAGQASSGYGRIDELLVGARCATPAGTIAAGRGPASAAGPDLLALLAGSEGTFGVLTEVSLRVRALPPTERFEAWACPSFAAGAAALRGLAQRGAVADVMRLSDEAETEVTLAQAGGWRVAALQRYLAARGLQRPCLLILGWDGSPEDVAHRRERTRSLLQRRARTIPLGGAVGRVWAAHRFVTPHLRDQLLDHGVFVETLETATSWAGLGPLYLAVRGAVTDALTARGTRPLVLTHISHLYPTGASLYLTLLARQEHGAELAQWRAVKVAASEAIVRHGATITHHHGVGLDHRPWLTDELGPLAVAALRAVKQRLDPAGILNPGKLLPEPDGADASWRHPSPRRS
jgi:alkyldihydroxyacetonephosphate synthase